MASAHSQSTNQSINSQVESKSEVCLARPLAPLTKVCALHVPAQEEGPAGRRHHPQQPRRRPAWTCDSPACIASSPVPRILLARVFEKVAEVVFGPVAVLDLPRKVEPGNKGGDALRHLHLLLHRPPRAGGAATNAIQAEPLDDLRQRAPGGGRWGARSAAGSAALTTGSSRSGGRVVDRVAAAASWAQLCCRPTSHYPRLAFLKPFSLRHSCRLMLA